MVRIAVASALFVVGSLVVTGSASAQSLVTTRSISLEGAKQIVAAAEAEAARNGWNVAIAIVDPQGQLVLFHKRDGTQAASVDIAIAKARTAARFRRPTSAIDSAITGDRPHMLAIEGILPLEGGLPIMVGNELVGAVGVSGATAQQDGQVAQAGVNAFQP